jgi:hypothetical protein
MRAAAVALTAALAAGCSFESRSPGFECSTTSNCTNDRHCIDGLCVTAGAKEGCPPGCNDCSEGTCIIYCDRGGFSCPSRVVCPAGMDCVVHCDRQNGCPQGVDCSAATACFIDCNASGACGGQVLCGSGPCEVDCRQSRCSGGVQCSSSCACQILCGSGQSCSGDMSCPAGCDAQPRGCTSSGAGCNTC